MNVFQTVISLPSIPLGGFHPRPQKHLNRKDQRFFCSDFTVKSCQWRSCLLYQWQVLPGSETLWSCWKGRPLASLVFHGMPGPPSSPSQPISLGCADSERQTSVVVLATLNLRVLKYLLQTGVTNGDHFCDATNSSRHYCGGTSPVFF